MSLKFDFAIIRKKQMECGAQFQKSVNKPFQLEEVSQAIVECKPKQALSMLDSILNPSKEQISNDITYSALILRSGLYCDFGRFSAAKDDLERAIFLLPNVLEGYLRLSDLEKRRGQIGKAEVALLLGLKVNPVDENLKERLAAIRAEDPVLPSVSSRNFSKARKATELQKQAVDEMALLFPNRSDFVMPLISGSLPYLEKLWKPELKNFTLGTIKSPLMHLVIFGATRYRGDQPKDIFAPLPEKDLQGYKDIIDFLFDRGCRLDARDKVGFTALSYAACQPPQAALLEYLLKKGADPNLQSVFGCHPLIHAVHTQNCQIASLLLHHGANPILSTNDGPNPHSMAGTQREMIALIEKYTCPKKPGKTCEHCGTIGGGMSRCGGCRVVFFCSKKCQKKNWADHKAICKVRAASHKRLVIIDMSGKHVLHFTDPTKPVRDAFTRGKFDTLSQDLRRHMVATHVISPAEEVLKNVIGREGNIIVKVQISILSSAHMLVYNQDKSFNCICDPEKLDAADVATLIKERGIDGLKAYFWAFMEPGNKDLILVTDPVLPAQPW